MATNDDFPMGRPGYFAAAVLALILLFSDAKAEVAPLAAPQAAKRMLTGVGYAPISSQPAATDEERRLLAIRASQLAAIRNLAEQIYGVRLAGSSATAGSALRSDSMRASVDGLVAGARIVRITPKGKDVYETVMEIDRPGDTEGARQ